MRLQPARRQCDAEWRRQVEVGIRSAGIDLGKRVGRVPVAAPVVVDDRPAVVAVRRRGLSGSGGQPGTDLEAVRVTRGVPGRQRRQVDRPAATVELDDGEPAAAPQVRQDQRRPRTADSGEAGKLVAEPVGLDEEVAHRVRPAEARRKAKCSPHRLSPPWSSVTAPPPLPRPAVLGDGVQVNRDRAAVEPGILEPCCRPHLRRRYFAPREAHCAHQRARDTERRPPGRWTNDQQPAGHRLGAGGSPLPATTA